MTVRAADVDVVIVTHNSERTIVSCLESLRDNKHVVSITVVDNASTDATLRHIAPPVRVVGSTANLGFGAGANRGAAATTAPYLCVLNADLVLRSSAIDHLAEYLESNPSAAIVGPTVRNPDGTVYPSARSFPNPLTAAGHAFVGLFWHENPWSKRYRRSDSANPDWVSGTAMVVRRDVFESLGGFDEGYFMYVEDLDLCWRARQLGHQVGLCSDAVVVHEVGGSSLDAPVATKRKLLAAHHRSAWRFARKTASGFGYVMLPLYGFALGGRLCFTLLREKYRPKLG
jgi:N-acetylglucosaminyl-diphospho-decaprenol L-rhamnosyltransferase